MSNHFPSVPSDRAAAACYLLRRMKGNSDERGVGEGEGISSIKKRRTAKVTMEKNPFASTGQFPLLLLIHGDMTGSCSYDSEKKKEKR